MRGLFGCDFLVDQNAARQNGVWLTEVNPRYPASTELVEAASGVSLVDLHRRACEGLPLDTSAQIEPRAAPQVLGKIVLYANRDSIAPDLSRFLPLPVEAESDTASRLPYAADLPCPGTQITRGQPVCTVFARAKTADACLKKLLRRARRMEQYLLT
jgi:predicted ATP-grasp superfamily ATP-dependent carboligase